jgi:hypothetical protein
MSEGVFLTVSCALNGRFSECADRTDRENERAVELSLDGVRGVILVRAIRRVAPKVADGDFGRMYRVSCVSYVFTPGAGVCFQKIGCLA